MFKLRKLAQILCVSSYRHALIFHGVAAGVEHAVLLQELGCKTVIDVGANRGQFALAARQALPDSTIFSFEPLKSPASRFRALFGDDSRVRLAEAAIGPECHEFTMHVSKRDDSSSLLPISSTQDELFPGTAEARTAKVSVGPLSDFVSEDCIETPALLKLDVQGYELQALQGCESILCRFAHIYVECSFIELYVGQALAHEVIGWLGDRGFRLRGVYNPARDKKARVVQADFLFSRE